MPNSVPIPESQRLERFITKRVENVTPTPEGYSSKRKGEGVGDQGVDPVPLISVLLGQGNGCPNPRT